MTDESLEAVLEELYWGEVAGEAFFTRLLERFTGPEQQFKLSCLLQLETEFKARLRPTLVAHGIDVREREDWRQQGRELADTLKSDNWPEAMNEMVPMMDGFVSRFKEMAPVVRAVYKDLGEIMMSHEQSIRDFATQEAAGNAETSIDGVIKILVFPLSPPDQPVAVTA